MCALQGGRSLMLVAGLTPGDSGGGAMLTREFRFIIDPRCLERISAFPPAPFLDAAARLTGSLPAVKIQLSSPSFFGPEDSRRLRQYRTFISDIQAPLGDGKFYVSKSLSGKHRKLLSAARENGQRALALLALAESTKADGVVSDATELLSARYALLAHHRIRVIPLDEFPRWIEICGIGHSTFVSAVDPHVNIPPDMFYQWLDQKNRSLIDWHSRVSPRISPETSEDLRSIVYNRYPFVIYSRDMVRFFELQSDHVMRRTGQRRLGSFVGFHLVNLYFHTWGLLDHLTLVANRHLGLRLPDNRCGIASDEFWAAITTRVPSLRKAVKQPRLKDWIAVMADMRHPAAHKAMLLPTQLVSHTAESQLSDAEVLEILKKEDPEPFELFNKDALQAMIPLMVSNWRSQKLKIIADGVVYVQGSSRAYVRPALNSVDYDVAMLNEVLDIFIAELFGDGPG
jgi:hypothetical protein